MKPGDTVQGVIKDSDPVVSTETLDVEYSHAPAVGKRYLIQIAEPGPYTIDMKSLFFDCYLVLRDGGGAVLVEDDDGYYYTHARIIFEAVEGDRAYLLDACALEGRRGEYTLQVTQGKSRQLSSQERKTARKQDRLEKTVIDREREG